MLQLKFVVHLENYTLNSSPHIFGPLCTKWLPNGKSDLIRLKTGNPNVNIDVWFERRGYVNERTIICDPSRKEVDEKRIPKQAVLDAGPLFGLMQINNISKQYLEALEKDIKENDYSEFCKMYIIDLLSSRLINFIDILKLNFGQYWLSNIKKWDSRSESLGHYCSMLELKWSINEGETWNKLIPTEKIIHIVCEMEDDFSNYLEEDDWQILKTCIENKYDPPFYLRILSNSFKLWEQGDKKYAVIEAITALELLLSNLVRNEISKNYSTDINMIDNLPIKTRLLYSVNFFNDIDFIDIDNVIQLIAVRNELVHEGKGIPTNINALYNSYKKVIQKLSTNYKIKFPSFNHGNVIEH